MASLLYNNPLCGGRALSIEPVRAWINIEARYCAPPGSGQGGYVAGRLAALLGTDAEVTLRRPTPLDVDLKVVESDGTLVLAHDGQTLAGARESVVGADPVPAARWEDAVAAAHRPYTGAEGFETCFVCGPAAAASECLGVFPQPLSDRIVGAPWRPPGWAADATGHVLTEYLWEPWTVPASSYWISVSGLDSRLRANSR